MFPFFLICESDVFCKPKFVAKCMCVDLQWKNAQGSDIAFVGGYTRLYG